jgi:hypothetical protein
VSANGSAAAKVTIVCESLASSSAKKAEGGNPAAANTERRRDAVPCSSADDGAMASEASTAAENGNAISAATEVKQWYPSKNADTADLITFLARPTAMAAPALLISTAAISNATVYLLYLSLAFMMD